MAAGYLEKRPRDGQRDRELLRMYRLHRAPPSVTLNGSNNNNNNNLHCITKVDSPACPECGHPCETVAHYILDCVAEGDAHVRMAFRLGPAAHSLQALLTEPKAVHHLFCYIHDTRRFAASYGDLTLHEADR